MKTLEFEIPEGFEVDNLDKKNGRLTFKPIPKDIKQRIKTIEDVLNDNNVTEAEVDKMFENAPEHFKYQYIAELLCKSLNEGWTPDWDDDDQWKYYPWFNMSPSGFRYGGCGRWRSGSYVGSRLCLKSRELAIYAGEQFTDLYKKFMITN